MIRIASAQYPITRHDSWSAWELHMRSWIEEAVDDNARVLVFPEYGAAELVSLCSDEVQADLQKQILELGRFKQSFLQFFSMEAKKHEIAILAPSLPLLEPGFARPVNRAYFFAPDGSFDFQDKKNMTRFEEEVWKVGPGVDSFKVFQAFGAKFGVSVCFDVEFPHPAHALARQGVQILLAPSCTETMKGMNRVHIGARARAMENQFYVVVAQTVGNSEWSQAADINTGTAAFYSTCDGGFPDDGVLAQGDLNKPQWVCCDLDVSLIEKVRSEGQVFNYRWMLKG